MNAYENNEMKSSGIWKQNCAKKMTENFRLSDIGMGATASKVKLVGLLQTASD